MKAPAKDESLGKDYVLAPDEYERLVDERVQRLLGMSADEFRTALRHGSLPDTPAVGYLRVLVGADRR